MSLRMMFGGQTDEYDFHYFGWDFDLLKGLLKNVGFKNIEKVKAFHFLMTTSDLCSLWGANKFKFNSNKDSSILSTTKSLIIFS